MFRRMSSTKEAIKYAKSLYMRIFDKITEFRLHVSAFSYDGVGGTIDLPNNFSAKRIFMKHHFRTSG